VLDEGKDLAQLLAPEPPRMQDQNKPQVKSKITIAPLAR
jgi:hypothetical protein